MHHFQALLMVACTVAGTLSAASLGGVVLNESNTPLRRVDVVVHASDSSDNVLATTGTDTNGHFQVDDLPAGRYAVTAHRNGYLRMSFGAEGPALPGTPIRLGADEQRKDLVIHLVRSAVLSGVVFNSEGDPMPGVFVSLLIKGLVRGKHDLIPRQAEMTDDRGQFRFFGLSPDSYGLVAGMMNHGGPPEPGGVVPSYYPGVLDRRQAQTISVSAGKEVSNIVLRLAQLQLASVRVQVASPFEPPEGVRPQVLLLRADTGTFMGGMPAPGIENTGEFTFESVTPGPYNLTANLEAGGHLYYARERIEVGSGQHLATSLRLSPAIDFKGTLAVEGATPADVANHRVTLISGDGNQQGQLAAEAVQPDGTFVIHNVPPGLWDINAEPVPPGGYIKAMTLGKEDVLRKDMFVTPSTTDTLKIVIGAKGGEVHGSVEGDKRGLALLAPEGADREVLSFFQVARTNGRGEFDLRGVTPGAYRAYVFETLPDGQAWADPAFLEPHRAMGKAIQIHEGERVEIEKLPLIPHS